METTTAEDFQILSKKYKQIKKELFLILWEILPKHNTELNILPKITEEKNYALKDELGKGRYGTVFKAFKHGNSMAAKVIDKNKCNTYTALQRLCKEISILKLLSQDKENNSTIKLYNVISHPQELIIFTEDSDCDLF